MLSKKPIDCDKITEENTNKQILRMGILAEIDAINLYEQMADTTTDPDIKKILLEIAKDEKTHIGQFQALLVKLDEEQMEELVEGKDENDEILSGQEEKEEELEDTNEK